MVPSWVFVNTQVMSWPATVVTWADAASSSITAPASVHSISGPLIQPSGTVSVIVTSVPGVNGRVMLSPSLSVASWPPMSNVKSVGDPSGSVCFSTVTVDVSFVITQSVTESGKIVKVSSGSSRVYVNGLTRAWLQDRADDGLQSPGLR